VPRVSSCGMRTRIAPVDRRAAVRWDRPIPRQVAARTSRRPETRSPNPVREPTSRTLSRGMPGTRPSTGRWPGRFKRIRPSGSILSATATRTSICRRGSAILLAKYSRSVPLPMSRLIRAKVDDSSRTRSAVKNATSEAIRYADKAILSPSSPSSSPAKKDNTGISGAPPSSSATIATGDPPAHF